VVSNVYVFSVAAGFCFDFLPAEKAFDGRKSWHRRNGPDGQDCDKNFIRLGWKAAGFDVVDLHNTIQPDTRLDKILERNLSVVDISCMANRCVANVRKLLSGFTVHAMNLPVFFMG
jgi:hypothetical protein